MTTETFFEKFELFAETPNAVAKMRELVLELAVRGKLVAQDPEDEPAGELLKRILQERRELNRISRTDIRGLNHSEQLDWQIPDTWCWQTLEDILISGPTNGFSPKAVEYETPVRSLTLSATTSGRFKGEHSKFIPNDISPDSDLWLRDGDILVQRGNSIEYVGVSAVYRGESNRFVYPDLMMKLRVAAELEIDFIHLAMSTELARDFLRARASGTSGSMPKINQGTLKSLPIPLPPLAEQRRIVARVDELMGLCDGLEEQQKERETRQGKLVRAAIGRFGEAPTPANLEVLFHPAVGISPSELRKTILTLAVQGKLVAQDPEDEPAEIETVERKPTSEGRSAPFELPNSWRWVRLGRVAELINGDRSKNYPNKAEYVQEGVAWINTGHIEPDGTLSLDSMHYISRRKFDSLRSGKVQRGDLVYCLRGATLGKTAIITQFDEGAVASSLVIIRLSSAVDSKFAYRVLTSPLGRAQIFQFDNGSAQPNLSANNVKKYWVPLPPLVEQMRIVARVEELMGLVDQLEGQIVESRERGVKLMEALVGELTAR